MPFWVRSTLFFYEFSPSFSEILWLESLPICIFSGCNTNLFRSLFLHNILVYVECIAVGYHPILFVDAFEFIKFKTFFWNRMAATKKHRANTALLPVRVILCNHFGWNITKKMRTKWKIKSNFDYFIANCWSCVTFGCFGDCCVSVANSIIFADIFNKMIAKNSKSAFWTIYRLEMKLGRIKTMNEAKLLGF